jgi:hypothetical protein
MFDETNQTRSGEHDRGKRISSLAVGFGIREFIICGARKEKGKRS